MEQLKNFFGLIYRATLLLDGRSYVGLTTHTLSKRKKQHIYDAKNKKTYFYNALRKYHNENYWEWEIIDYANSLEELKEKEIFWIKQLKSLESGFNSTCGGDFCEMKEEVKQKISQSRKGKTAGAENPFYGQKHTEETKQKMSESAQKRWENPEVIEFYSKLGQERFLDPVSRKEAGEKTKASFQNPEIKEKHRLGLIEAFKNPETKEKMSMAKKGKPGNKASAVRKKKVSLKNRKLTDDQVIEILKKIKENKMSLREIAKDYKVCYDLIISIKNKTYALSSIDLSIYST